ncbi:hypothetical protein GNE09_29350 (plasmid) [Bacillus cereus]|uniref:hypothetical protein n=1 Tax=Bacillus thuringiensis TaxID=1428 RepID=UPI001317E24B|nr:hypothetical protein [Bacillus thuringiensis]QGV10643.1 hypothetical protein GNE09_29350 [Bacillus cereus]
MKYKDRTQAKRRFKKVLFVSAFAAEDDIEMISSHSISDAETQTENIKPSEKIYLQE